MSAKRSFAWLLEVDHSAESVHRGEQWIEPHQPTLQYFQRVAGARREEHEYDDRGLKVALEEDPRRGRVAERRPTTTARARR
jgi:hypothetical protein